MIGASCHAQEAATADAPTLTIGSEAPSLDIEHWLSNGHGKFEPVTKFEPGKVYVVEFWATWCGPCIASMPHLVGLQQRYGDQGVMIVSVSDEPLETVESFLKGEVQGNEAIETAREVLASTPSSETDDDEDEDEDEEDEDEERTTRTKTTMRTMRTRTTRTTRTKTTMRMTQGCPLTAI